MSGDYFKVKDLREALRILGCKEIESALIKVVERTRGYFPGSRKGFYLKELPGVMVNRSNVGVYFHSFKANHPSVLYVEQVSATSNNGVQEPPSIRKMRRSQSNQLPVFSDAPSADYEKFKAIYYEIVERTVEPRAHAVDIDCPYLWKKELGNYARHFRLIETTNLRKAIDEATHEPKLLYPVSWFKVGWLSMVVPLRSIETGEVIGAEIIPPVKPTDKTLPPKYAVKGSRKGLSCWSLYPLKEGQEIVVAEGVATALAVHEIESKRRPGLNACACMGIESALEVCYRLQRKGLKVEYFPDKVQKYDVPKLAKIRQVAKLRASPAMFTSEQVESMKARGQGEPSDWADLHLLSRLKHRRKQNHDVKDDAFIGYCDSDIYETIDDATSDYERDITGVER